MADITVSSAVDTFLQSANQSEMRTNIGASSGFDFDQQSEPSSPEIGQTWRERDGTNLIIGEWFWTGSLWLSLGTTKFINTRDASSNITGSGGGQTVFFPFNSFIESVSVYMNLILSPVDATNYFEWNLARARGDGFSNETPLVSGFRYDSGSFARWDGVPVNQRLDLSNPYSNAGLRLNVTATGSPGTIRVPWYATLREIRA